MEISTEITGLDEELLTNVIVWTDFYSTPIICQETLENLEISTALVVNHLIPVHSDTFYLSVLKLEPTLIRLILGN